MSPPRPSTLNSWGEVLHTIRELADEGRTLLLVTHELGFAWHFADRVIFIENGVIHGSARKRCCAIHANRAPRPSLSRFAERAF